MTIDTPSFLLGSTIAFGVTILERAVGVVLARMRLKKILATLPPAPEPPIPPERALQIIAIPSDERVTPVSPE